MSLQRNDKSLIIAKIESAYGTDAAPTAAANAFIVSEPKIEKIVEAKNRKVVLPWYGKPADNQIPVGVKISFQHEAIPSGVAGTAPKIGTLLRACNMTEVIVAGTSVAYSPNSSLEGESVTLWFYKDGHLYKVPGCVGNVKITFKSGEILMFDFEFTGLFTNTFASDAAYPASVTYDTTSPLPCLNSGFSFAGANKVVESFSLDLGNTIEKRTDCNNAYGVSKYYISQRATKGSMDPEAELFATVNYFTLQDNKTENTITFTLGANAGSKIKVDVTKAVVTKVTAANRGNIGIFQLDFEANPSVSAGNNETTFTFL